MVSCPITCTCHVHIACPTARMRKRAHSRVGTPVDINKLQDIVYNDKVNSDTELDDESDGSDDDNDSDDVCARCGGTGWTIAAWCSCGAPVCFGCDESDINIPTWCSPGCCGNI